MHTKVLLNYCLLKTPILRSFLFKKGKKKMFTSAYLGPSAGQQAQQCCWQISDLQIPSYISGKGGWRETTYCKQCMVQTRWNCHFFVLVISNFSLCCYTASYILCIRFPSLTCIQNTWILVLSVGIWSYPFLPALLPSVVLCYILFQACGAGLCQLLFSHDLEQTNHIKSRRKRWNQQHRTSHVLSREWQLSWSCFSQISWAWWLCYTWKKELVWAERWEEQDILDLGDSPSPWLQPQASFPLTETEKTKSCPFFVLQSLILMNQNLICRSIFPSNNIKQFKILAVKTSFCSLRHYSVSKAYPCTHLKADIPWWNALSTAHI